MMTRLLPLLALAVALAGCGSGEPGPSGSDSIESSMKGLKAGPGTPHSGPAKTDATKAPGS